MEKFEEATVEVVMFENCDIITVSPPPSGDEQLDDDL